MRTSGRGSGEGSVLERAIDGDSHAAAEILASHLPALRRFAKGRMRGPLSSKESVSDILQSTFREVIRDLPGFDDYGAGNAAFKSWLYRTALRKLQDHERYYRRQKRDVAREVHPGSKVPFELARHSNSPSRALIDREERECLARAFERLPENYGEVLRMRYFRGLTAEQIGERLDKQPCAVRSLQARALARLARVMGPRRD